MYPFNTNFYYISFVLQAICVFHCIRKRNQNKWIWIIVFLPFIGCLAYFFTEIFSNHEMRRMKSGIGEMFNPSGSIRSLEKALRFSDSFQNKVALADAYLEAGYTDKAIALYESSLVGTFAENEHVCMQLMVSYYESQRYEDILRITKKVYQLPQFARSKPHLLYALALEKCGSLNLAELEFNKMIGRFSNYEARYQYGLFLLRAQRNEDALRVFSDIVHESSHLNSWERRDNRVWFSKAKAEIKKASITEKV